MKILTLLLIAASTCFGSEISGVWRLKHATADGRSAPIAVQVQQCGNHIQVLKLVFTVVGKRVEQLCLSAAAIHALARAIEITVAGKTWIIGARGEPTIHEANGQRVVLEPVGDCAMKSILFVDHEPIVRNVFRWEWLPVRHTPAAHHDVGC